MLVVRLDSLQQALDYIKYINEAKLENILWVDTGIPCKVSKEEITEFKYTGLNNVDFARSYKGWVK